MGARDECCAGWGIARESRWLWMDDDLLGVASINHAGISSPETGYRWLHR